MYCYIANATMLRLLYKCSPYVGRPLFVSYDNASTYYYTSSSTYYYCDNASTYFYTSSST